MMAPEPLRSAMAVGSAEDTSLALPSDHNLRTGQQRVLDQVHSIKRSKSKQWRSSSQSSSPTNLNPQTSTTYTEFGSFRFSPSKTNGAFSRASATMSTGYNKAMTVQKSRTLSTNTKTSKWTQNTNGLKTSRSDPVLVPQAPYPTVMRAKGQAAESQQIVQTRVNRNSSYSVTNGQMTNSQTRIVHPPSVQSHTDGKMGTMKISKADILQQSAVNSAVSMTDLSLKDAVDFLSHPDDNFQLCGANYIQHNTFKEDDAKQEVNKLGGIPLLVTLLQSSNPEVSQAAAGALRNLVFKDQINKFEVRDCGGIAKALQLLKETNSTETQKQITGLLWNLSSADKLKEELASTALSPLNENVIMPFTSWSENTTNNNVHPDVFYNATGYLRNLSCGKVRERNSMRQCKGLIDSLMSYVKSCVAEENPDDKSVENCVCILHNLSYQLETESPSCFNNLYPQSANPSGRRSPTIGCFSSKSSKVQKELVAMPEDSDASGETLLCQPSTMQTYLSLLGTSKNDATLEACCGALQNLTAKKGSGSSILSYLLVQKMGAMLHMPTLLNSSNLNVQKAAIFLLSNLSQNSILQASLAKQVLPYLTEMLSSGPRDAKDFDKPLAAICNTTRTLMLSDTEFSKKIINKQLLSSLADLSDNRTFNKGSKAASVLLYSLWDEKNLQGALKKMGMSKGFFVNENTLAAQRIFQATD